MKKILANPYLRFAYQWLDSIKINKYAKFDPNIPQGSRVISGAGNVCFLDDHALPDTSMRLSDYVLQTFLVNIINIFSLAIAIFSIFKMANGNFKMAAKFI